MPLVTGYYRISNTSSDLRRCHDFGDDSGCIGGIGSGEGPCKPSLVGPYCSLCKVRDSSEYYDSGKNACVACEGNLLFSMGVLAAVIVGIGGLMRLWQWCKHRTPRRLAAILGTMWRLYQQLSLRAKMKQVEGA